MYILTASRFGFNIIPKKELGLQRNYPVNGDFKVISVCSEYSFLSFVQNKASDAVFSRFVLNSSLIAS